MVHRRLPRPVAAVALFLALACAGPGAVLADGTGDLGGSTDFRQRVEGAPVLVYFSPSGDEPFDAVVPVRRVVFPIERRIGTAALETLIAGPTGEERARGLRSGLEGAFFGESNCGGRDFALTIDRQGRATVRFCRTVASGGIGDDARIIAQVGATLRQFRTISSVRLLNDDGGCFGDMSGHDFCLQTNRLQPPLVGPQAGYREAHAQAGL